MQAFHPKAYQASPNTLMKGANDISFKQDTSQKKSKFQNPICVQEVTAHVKSIDESQKSEL